MMAIINNILFYHIILVIIHIITANEDDVPYWSEMAQLLKLQSIGPRIIGGQDAFEGQSPWMVSFFNKQTREHFCGGALIGKRTVLTAGHCVLNGTINGINRFKQPSMIAINYDGINRLKLKMSNQVTKIILHPKFKFEIRPDDDIYNIVLLGDIAIIHMQHDVIESETVRIIPIIDKTITPQSEALVTGWGLTYYNHGKLSRNDSSIILQSTRMTIIGRKRCNALRDPLPSIAPIFICGINPNSTLCLMDSGSPLVQNGKLVGITSHGRPNCTVGDPNVFTNPVFVKKWINRNIL